MPKTYLTNYCYKRDKPSVNSGGSFLYLTTDYFRGISSSSDRIALSIKNHSVNKDQPSMNFLCMIVCISVGDFSHFNLCLGRIAPNWCSCKEEN